MPQNVRTVRMLGEDVFQKIVEKRVIVFGLGGVGGHAAEALVRAGVKKCTFVDGDTVDISNINRQLLATHAVVGKSKAEVMVERAKAICPDGEFVGIDLFYDETTAGRIDLSQYDCVVDAIDSVRSKVLLIKNAVEAGVRVVSSMGAGNKIDPTQFRVADLAKTNVCPLARVMRRELKKHGIEHIEVVYSEEKPFKTLDGERSPGSISFVPSAAGIVLASAVIRKWIEV